MISTGKRKQKCKEENTVDEKTGPIGNSQKIFINKNERAPGKMLAQKAMPKTEAGTHRENTHAHTRTYTETPAHTHKQPHTDKKCVEKCVA